MIKTLQAALPELGKIKTGMKGEETTSAKGNKFRPPVKLNHFIITGMERDENGDLLPDTDLMDTLKKSKDAKLDKDGNLVGIPIRLLYNDIQLNFPNRLSCYVGGKCVCFGDGETAHTRDGRNIQCPCNKIDFGYDGKDKCKYNGKLYCVIDGTKSIGACHVLRTTSINTVQSIIGGLSFIQAAAGGMLAFLPLQLVLVPKTTITPSGAPVTVYVSSIVYNGSISDLRQTALSMAQDRAKYLIEMDHIEESAKQLMATVVESDEEAMEVQEEFYPDAVEVDVPAANIEPEKEKPQKQEKKEKKVEPKKEPELKPEPEKPKKETLKESIEKKTAIPPVEEKKVEPEPEKTEEKPADEQDGTWEVQDVLKNAEIHQITDEQKRKIIKLKKVMGITDKAVWEGYIKEAVPGVTTALDMTMEEANTFIALLVKKGGDVPW